MVKLVYSVWHGIWEWEHWHCSMGNVIEEVGLLVKGKGGKQRLVWEVGGRKETVGWKSGSGTAGVILWEMGVNIVQ